MAIVIDGFVDDPSSGSGGGGTGTVADGSVTTAKLADGAVTSAKVDATTIETIAHKNAANGYAGLDASGTIAATHLGSGAPDNTKFLRGDGSWVVGPVADGEVTTVKLADAAVTSAKVDSSVEITANKGVAGGYAGLDAVTGTVPVAELASGAPDTTKFLRGDGTWDANTVADGAISTAQLADAAVTTAKIAAGNVTSALVDASVEVVSRKNANNGYAGLDANGKIGVTRINPSVTNGQVLTTVAGATAWAAPTGGGSSPVGVAGNVLRYGASGVAVAAGAMFSAAAYGVVGDNLTTSAAANTTNLNACIADALAAGSGATVLLDWTGTAYTNGGHFLESRITYQGSGFAKLKLNASQPAGTNIFQTHNFTTQTQNNPNVSQGEFEFTCQGLWLDGNKAGQTWVAPTSGGHGLAIVGYGYRVEDCFIENCFGAGIWREYSTTIDAPSTASTHQRATRVDRVWLANNAGNSVAATNQRATDGKASLTCGQYTTWGPGDSSFGYLEIYSTGAVNGTAYQQLGMDFTAGTFRDFATVGDQLVVWGNHSIGINLDSTWSVEYLHLEGATTCYQLNSNAQENKIHGGDIFNIQTGGTLINLIGSCAHFGYWQFCSSQLQHNGTMLNVASASAFQEGEFHLTMQLNVAATNTLTAGAGGAPTSARVFDMMVSNFGGATVTPGWCTAIPVGGTVFRYSHSKQPVALGRGTQLAPMFGSGLTTGKNATGTVTAAELATRFVESANTGAITLTTDTGTNISSQWQGELSGDFYAVTLANRGTGTITLAAGTGVTMVGNLSVPASKNARLEFRNTGSNAWTCYTNVSA